ncbi:MAG: ABC transporter ATP-binding protein [Acidobacteria bacterium]|nr:MAG: ABC transporter ATP-binding protein [Acidobacteriota bacterium]
MTKIGFVVKNTFRNQRRSMLTVLSIAFSLLLLTLMMTIWRTFYIDQGAPDSAKRLMTRHRVSLTFFLPGYYREKIRGLPGVVNVAPMTWFGGRYKDDKPENFFAQFATDPEEYLKVAADKDVPRDQAEAWIRDRSGAMVDVELAKRYGWKIGDHVTLQGTIFPVNPELTIRAIYTMTPANKTFYFHSKYLEEAVSWYKGQTGFFFTRVASSEDIAPTARAIDDMFRNSPQPTKTESEKAFLLSFIAMLGNVKAFILSICAAVVFAILLVAANTMAMSIRERTREVAMLRTLGFTRGRILSLFVGEAVALSVAGGLLGVLIAAGLLEVVAHSPFATGILFGLRVSVATMGAAVIIAAFVGLISAYFPAYNASRVNIVEGLRHIG